MRVLRVRPDDSRDICDISALTHGPECLGCVTFVASSFLRLLARAQAALPSAGLVVMHDGLVFRDVDEVAAELLEVLTGKGMHVVAFVRLSSQQIAASGAKSDELATQIKDLRLKENWVYPVPEEAEEVPSSERLGRYRDALSMQTVRTMQLAPPAPEFFGLLDPVEAERAYIEEFRDPWKERLGHVRIVGSNAILDVIARTVSALVLTQAPIATALLLALGADFSVKDSTESLDATLRRALAKYAHPPDVLGWGPEFASPRSGWRLLRWTPAVLGAIYDSGALRDVSLCNLYRLLGSSHNAIAIASSDSPAKQDLWRCLPRGIRDTEKVLRGARNRLEHLPQMANEVGWKAMLEAVLLAAEAWAVQLRAVGSNANQVLLPVLPPAIGSTTDAQAAAAAGSIVESIHKWRLARAPPPLSSFCKTPANRESAKWLDINTHAVRVTGANGFERLLNALLQASTEELSAVRKLPAATAFVVDFPSQSKLLRRAAEAVEALAPE